jgi:Bacterial TniB protein
MTLPQSHLTPAAASLLNDFDDQRIEAILSERWVSYPRAKHALSILDRLVAHPRTTRMPSLAIYGDSGMGKTMIMQKFCSDHSPAYNTEANKEQRPVVALQMTGKPSERRFYGQLLAATGMPRSPRADIVDLEQSPCRTSFYLRGSFGTCPSMA